MRTKKPPKVNQPQSLAVKYISEGQYLIGEHTLQRMNERNIDMSDVIAVICNGWHVPKRDRYCSINDDWSYCFEGKDFDAERNIRVIASFDNRLF